MSTSRHELRKFVIRHIGFSHWIKKERSNHSINILGFFAGPIESFVSSMAVWCFSHLGCIDILPNAPCARCRRLGSKIRAVMLSVVLFSHLGSTSAWTRQSRPSLFFSRVHNFSIETTIACCRFRLARQMAKWRNLLGVVHQGFHVVVPRVQIFFQGLLFFFLLSCSRVCLLDVSRLLGLTLRLFALVCSCHRDSLTRWRLSFEQEGVLFSQSSWLVPVRDNICVEVSDSLWGRSLHAMLKYEGPAFIVKNVFCSLCPSFLGSTTFSTTYSGYGLARSKRNASWCVECTFPDSWRTNPTNILNTESLFRVCFTHCSILLVLDLFRCWVPMPRWVCQWKTLRNPGRGIVQKGLLGRVGLRQRWLFWWTERYGFPCAPQHRPQWLHSWDTQNIETVWFSSLGTHEASR